jgi:hypothetical protein
MMPNVMIKIALLAIILSVVGVWDAHINVISVIQQAVKTVIQLPQIDN